MDSLLRAVINNDSTALNDFISSGCYETELRLVFGLLLQVAEDKNNLEVVSILQDHGHLIQLAELVELDDVANNIHSDPPRPAHHLNASVVDDHELGPMLGSAESEIPLIVGAENRHAENRQSQTDLINCNELSGGEHTCKIAGTAHINFSVGECMDYLVKMEQPDTLMNLFLLGLDENIRDSEGKGFIHYAATADNQVILRMLIDSGADVEARDLQHVTPLMMACRSTSLGCVDVLLEHTNNLNIIDHCDQTALHYAAKSDAACCAEKLLMRGIKFQLSMHRETELMVALSHNAENMVKLLVENNMDVNTRNRQLATALHYAAMYDCPAAIEQLSLVDALMEVDRHGYTPIAIAAKNGHHRALDALIRCYTNTKFYNMQTRNQKSPLQLAASMGQYECVELLLNAGAGIDYGSDLCLGAQGGNHQILALLLKTYRERLGSDWYMAGLETDWSVNKLQMSPLHIAAMYGYEECVKLLLAEGANPCHTMPATGETPLMLAVIKNYHRCAKLIIDAICKERSAALNILTPKRKTALHYAAKQGSLECAELLVKDAAAVDIKDSHGYTAMLLAVQAGHCEIVRLLLKANCDITASKQHGWNGLHLAALSNYPECALCLVQAGLDPDASTWISQVNPAQLAAKKGNTTILRLLLEYGSSVLHCDDVGMTPMHYAATNDNIDCIEVLVLYRSPVDPVTKLNQTPILLAAVQGCVSAMAMLLLYNSDVSTITSTDDVCKALDENRRAEAVCLLYQAHHKFYSQELCTMFSRPRTMKQQCRSVIRHCMGQGLEFINGLAMLQLPAALQKYIGMEDECNKYASHIR